MNGCRVCMTEEADVFLSLFSKPEQVSIADMISEISGLKISKGDGLPRFICKECSEDILKSYKVRRKCLDSDQQLRQALEKTNQRIKMVEFYLQKEIQKNDSNVEKNAVDISPEVLKNVLCDDEKLLEMLDSGDQIVEDQPEPENPITTVSAVIDHEKPPGKIDIKQERESHPVVDKAINADENAIQEAPVLNESPNVTVIHKEKVEIESCSSIANAPEEELEYTEEYLDVAGDEEEQTEETQYTIDAAGNIEQVLVVEKADSEYSQEEYGGKFICCGCDIHFNTNEELSQHSADEHEKMRLKNSAKPYECTVCYKRFLSEQRLILHQTYVYREKNHICEKCNAKFTCRGSLLNHLKTHADRTYVCDDCNKSFHTSSTLKSHRLLHTESKQFKCTAPNCKKSFLRKSDLHIHLVSHSDERPYECELCSSRFKSKAHLVHHGKVHTKEKPYKCNQCDKAFGTYSARKFHQLAHEGIHPYKCSYCDKIYQRNTKLQVHIRRIHTGERPFACDLCENMFFQNWELTAHKRKVHQVEPGTNECQRESAEGATEEDEEDITDEEYVVNSKRIKLSLKDESSRE